ncbi:hypothetical protein J4438_03210 [Candidatus Woesearchaeota archaeon]|nr:hypothetical protein [Candidatus Woesearchaeota archaeon]
MTFSKSFPKTDKKTTYPIWEEISLSNEEEKKVENLAEKETISQMKKCISQARQIMKETNLKDYQSDLINISIALFEKQASHSVYWKEQACKDKFDEKFKN